MKKYIYVMQCILFKVPNSNEQFQSPAQALSRESLVVAGTH